MSKKVSIIVITYNAKEDLRECLESLEKQDYDAIEIIVVNDASADGTSDFLRSFKAEAKSDIVIVTNETNLGVAGARNAGIRHSHGDIIAFTDSDCVVAWNWVSELVKAYGYKDVAAVGGKILDAGIENIWTLASKSLNHVSISEGFVSYIQGCNMSFKSEVLKKFLFNDEIKYGYEETLLCDYLLESGYKIYYNPKAVVHHKHRTSFFSLLKQKYLRGVSSIWYRRKKNKFIMLKRHAVLLAALFCIPFLTYEIILYFFFFLLSLFTLSLLRDEIAFQQKTFKEIMKTFPFIMIIELSHFAGSCSGLLRFRILSKHAKEISLFVYI